MGVGFGTCAPGRSPLPSCAQHSTYFGCTIYGPIFVVRFTVHIYSFIQYGSLFAIHYSLFGGWGLGRSVTGLGFRI